jgi:glycosyltransferase involved in cell wall biosynthesis
MKNDNLVECRVVACDRPKLLERALLSLTNQTKKKWKAIVFDDSGESSGKAVVDKIADKRIFYKKNTKRLGATGNLNQGFSRNAFLGGTYAFVLEDDNAIEPNFIEVSLSWIKKSKCPIVSLNQRCVVFDSGEKFKLKGTLRSEEKKILWTRERVLLNAFCGASLPNGGYFWRTGEVDLTVDENVREPQLQECIRQTLIPCSITLAPEPVSLWTLCPDEHIRRTKINNRKFGLSLHLFSKRILLKQGVKKIKNWIDQCENNEFKEKAESTLENVAYYAFGGRGLSKIKKIMKGNLKTLYAHLVVPAGTLRALGSLKL